MKFVKLLAPLFLVCMMCSAFTMKDKTNGMYIVGVSASFTDSVIYFTDVPLQPKAHMHWRQVCLKLTR